MQRYWPLDRTRMVTSPFGNRKGGFHYGVDFGRAGGSAGMPVYAVQSGTVIHAGAASGYGGPYPAGWLVIDSSQADGGGCLEYGHIVAQPGINVGTRVQAGQHIATINPNQRTNGGAAPHLHLSDMPGAYNPSTKQDPMRRLQGALEPGEAVKKVSKIYSGKALFLPDVLSPHLGSRLRVMPGWEKRGHGNFKDMRGLMWHHTGGPASAESIANGRPDLAGPLSVGHISRTGIATVVAAGVGWHAGQGSYPFLPMNMGNWHMLGWECEWPYPGSGVTGPHNAHLCRWNDAQIETMRDVATALTLHFGYGPDRNIDHKEYAGNAQGKWDRGYLDPGWFRGEVALDMQGKFGGNGHPPVFTPLPVQHPVIVAPGGWAHILIYKGMRGPQVAELQRRLSTAYRNTHGKGLVVDGDFGPATERAVASFQRASHLDPDGIVGPMTAAALNLKVV